MSRRMAFSHYLLGSLSLERPPFFYAYSGMWLHLVASLFLLPFLALPLSEALSSLVIGALSLGILVYSALAREYGLLVNVIPYGLSMMQLAGGHSAPLMPAAILVALASGYLLLSREYRRYTREVFGGEESGIPLWITGVMALVLVLLFLYGLSLVSGS